MIYGYIRVSSDKQTVENQRFEIRRFCKDKETEIGGWIEETVSGTLQYSKRALGTLLRDVKKGDIIICSEISRLGRSVFMIMEILNICLTKGCQVWTIKDNYRLGDDIQSKVLAFAFGLAAEIERQLISQRTKEALARKRADGIVLGRPKGIPTKEEKFKLFPLKDHISVDLRGGMSQRKIAQKYGIDKSTLNRFIRRFLDSPARVYQRVEEMSESYHIN